MRRICSHFYRKHRGEFIRVRGRCSKQETLQLYIYFDGEHGDQRPDAWCVWYDTYRFRNFVSHGGE